jgi:transposase
MGIPPYKTTSRKAHGGIPMSVIVPPLKWSVKEKMKKRFRRCRSAAVRIRYLIIFNLWHGRGAYDTADLLDVHNTTVYRVVRRFRERGEVSLWDRREDNGEPKLTEEYLGMLQEVVRSTPVDHGWRRPTWTCELLVETLVRKTGVRIHPDTMSRALALIKARRGRPRPRVGCPWHPAAKTRRLNRIQALLAGLSKKEAAVYEDEVDIHLNPKIGLDWMARGQQKEVMTPGKNQKRYLAGALEVRTSLLHWVEGERKTSDLFLSLLDKLLVIYAQAKVIHIILDNYRIHSSQIVGVALAGFASRIRLHFLPPYCPDHNKIERIWQDLHAAVTRNHQRRSMTTLMQDVRYHLHKRNRKILRRAA